tara:strand:+ start:102 stop:1232 length:1131 start_codon:yes stop_codon:yes gene_type:complete
MRKKISAVISHSFGEIEVLTPIFFQLKGKYNFDIYLIFTVEKIYNDFLENRFYLNTINDLGINIIYSKMINKIDYDQKLKKGLLSKIYFKIIDILFCLLFIKRTFYLFDSDYFMNETTNQYNSLKIFKKFGLNYDKNQIVYHHGHSLNGKNKNANNFCKNPQCKYLLFSRHNLDWSKNNGYENNVIIGFPKFYDDWIKYIRQFSHKYIKDNNYIVIFTRAVHPYYMDIEKYNYLIENSYNAIRIHYPNHKILIKLHPRQSISDTQALIHNKKFHNVFISFLPAGILANNAVFTISLWTGAILDSLAQRVPALEFYAEANRFREANPLGSMYKYLGIHSAKNFKEISEHISDIKNNKYSFPQVIHEFFKIEDLNIFK